MRVDSNERNCNSCLISFMTGTLEIYFTPVWKNKTCQLENLKGTKQKQNKTRRPGGVTELPEAVCPERTVCYPKLSVCPS